MNLLTFIRYFSSIIKNHTTVFRDIGSSNISHATIYYRFITYVTKDQIKCH